MTQQRTLLTADEFFRLYSHRDGKFELVEGEVVEMAPVNEEHGEIAGNVTTAFNVYSRQRGAGRAGVEIGYRLGAGPDTVRGPDVSFALGPRRPAEARRSGFVPGAPDIAVEVVSPNDSAAELERKIGEYLAAGSLRVWAIYPASRSVTVRRPDGSAVSYSGDDVVEDEELLPGFSLPLAEIFR